MQWQGIGHFFDMGGYAFFVWGSYAVCAAVIVAELLALRARRRRAIAAVRASRRPA